MLAEAHPEAPHAMATIRAVYRDGVFHPRSPVHLGEGEEVVIELPANAPEGRTPDWLARFGPLPDAVADRMATAINEAFEI